MISRQQNQSNNLTPGDWPTELLEVCKPDVCFCMNTFLCPCMQYAANMGLLYR